MASSEHGLRREDVPWDQLSDGAVEAVEGLFDSRETAAKAAATNGLLYAVMDGIVDAQRFIIESETHPTLDMTRKVEVTAWGDKFHKPESCPSVKARDASVEPDRPTIKRALREGYEPCGRCFGGVH